MVCSFNCEDGDANTVAKNIENEEFEIGFRKAFEDILVVVECHVLQN